MCCVNEKDLLQVAKPIGVTNLTKMSLNEFGKMPSVITFFIQCILKSKIQFF